MLKKSKLLKTTLEAEQAEKERRERIKKRREEVRGIRELLGSRNLKGVIGSLFDLHVNAIGQQPF